jgi:hypothetical protein
MAAPVVGDENRRARSSGNSTLHLFGMTAGSVVDELVQNTAHSPGTAGERSPNRSDH